jgi:peptide/nickel transport system substrate-binding protein
MSKKIYVLFGLFVVAALLLAGCGPEEETPVVTEAPTGGGEVVEPVETDVVEPVDDVPAPPPVTRVGGWLDMIIVVEEVNPESAVARLLAGELDIYAYTVNDGNVFETVKASPELKYVTSAGNFNELAFNVVGPEFNDTGKLNPFSSARVRSATGMLIDRDYIVEEIIDGLGIPKFTNMNSLFPDYARNVAVVKEMESQYAYNPEKAAEIITEEMEAMGATFEDGMWMYGGEQVEIIYLIRIEDERLEIGDYVANLFEDLGFASVRDYKSAADAAPIRDGDPHAGLWHIYTGGWISTSISRNDQYDYGFFDSDLYFTDGVYPYHDTQNPEYDEAMLKLWNSEFATMEERGELMATCIRGFMAYASRIMLFDATSFTPMRVEVEVTADLAGAVAGADIWAYTLRRTGEVGGAMTVAMPSILTQPWNPVGGSSWVYDQALFAAIQTSAIFNDPFTGLGLPQMLDRAEVVIEEGLPVGVTLDWVTLEFVPEIVVPEDAWADWDAETQTFITVGEADAEAEEARTAAAKYVCYYREDLFETTWHDGSLFSMGDVIMGIIFSFDPAK